MATAAVTANMTKDQWQRRNISPLQISFIPVLTSKSLANPRPGVHGGSKPVSRRFAAGGKWRSLDGGSSLRRMSSPDVGPSPVSQSL